MRGLRLGLWATERAVGVLGRELSIGIYYRRFALGGLFDATSEHRRKIVGTCRKTGSPLRTAPA